MTTTDKVLFIGGLLTLTYGTLLGYPMTMLRMREGNPPTPRYLTVTHVGAVLQGVILFGLTLTITLAIFIVGDLAAL